MDNHFECMWDMFRDVPSIETPGVSVLDEYYWLNKHDPNYSLCRASEKCGQDAHTDKKFTLDKDSALALSKLFMTPEKALEDKKISEILPDSFWDTNFWLYWQTMFAFQRWSSALEMKRYLCRYCHHIDGLPDFSALRFTKYNQYESLIKNGAGESWDLWKNIAAQAKNGEYGNPDKFCDDFEATNWMSATVETSDEEIIQKIISICKRDPREGNYVKKAMRDCTGEEVCREWLYHIGVPTDQIDDWAKNRCNTTTCFMPYINAFFQPRKESDRPLVVPEVWGSKYDVRELLRAAYYAVDKKPIDELPLSLKEKLVLKKLIKAVEGTDLEILLKESGLLQ